MNRRVLFLVAVFLIIGAVVIPPLIPRQPKVTEITVIEATQDIEPGTIITGDVVEIKHELKEGPVVQASEQVLGTIAKKSIKKGDIITSEMTAPIDPRAGTALDKEVISFYAEIDEAVGGILKPGDMIDIYAYHLVQEDEPTRQDKIGACILVVDSHGASGNPTRWTTSEAEGEEGSQGFLQVKVDERVVPASIVTVAVDPDVAWRIIEFLGSKGFRAWVTLSHESCWMPPTPAPTPTPIPPTPVPSPTPTPVPPTPTPTPTPGPMPDLDVISITSDPSPMIKDQPGTVLVELRNQGSAGMVSTGWVGLYLDRPARAEADKQMVCPPLGVDESAVISYTVTLDEVGYHVLTAWADGLEAIPEEDEANNQDSASILVVEPPTPTPTPTHTPTPPPPPTPEHYLIHLIFTDWWVEITETVDLEGRRMNLELESGGEGIYYAEHRGMGFEMTVKNNTDERLWVQRQDEDPGADVSMDGQDGREKRYLEPGEECQIKVQLLAGFNEATVVLVDD
jgi:hypothetical protein